MKTTAKLSEDGTHYVLNGAKTFITGGVQADRVLVVRPDRRARRRRPPRRHVAPRGRRQERGLRGRPQAGQARPAAPPTPPNCPSPTSRSPSRTCSARRARPSSTWRTTCRRSGWASPIGATRMAAAAVEFATQYVKERTVFGRTGRLVPEHQVRAGRVPGRGRRRAGRRRPRPGGLDAGELTAADAAKAKLFCTEVAGRVIDKCLQLHGGYGYMLEYPIARLYADTRVSASTAAPARS